MIPWWQRNDPDFRNLLYFIALVIFGVVLTIYVFLSVCPDLLAYEIVSSQADKSLWIDEKQVADNNYVYHEDPCVEALRGAMEKMEPWFIPLEYAKQPKDKQGGELWKTTEYWTHDEIVEYKQVLQLWEETKVQCWRH